MISSEENEQNKKGKNGVSGQNINQVNEPKHVELTKEQRFQRAFETGRLFEEKKGLIKARAEREEQKKHELVELRGTILTVGEVQRLVSVDPSPYKPEFSYSESAYFKELYRQYYPERDYKEYPKPWYMSQLFRDLIYGRFDRTILPTLDKLNPMLSGTNARKRKLFQHLNTAGKDELRQYRDETVKVAESCPDGQPYEFRKRLYVAYGVPYQLDFFEKND